jgi:hypothetical protein
MHSATKVLLIAVALAEISKVSSHGMIVDPINRASRWRYQAIRLKLSIVSYISIFPDVCARPRPITTTTKTFAAASAYNGDKTAENVVYVETTGQMLRPGLTNWEAHSAKGQL